MCSTEYNTTYCLLSPAYPSLPIIHILAKQSANTNMDTSLVLSVVGVPHDLVVTESHGSSIFLKRGAWPNAYMRVRYPDIDDIYQDFLHLQNLKFPHLHAAEFTLDACHVNDDFHVGAVNTTRFFFLSSEVIFNFIPLEAESEAPTPTKACLQKLTTLICSPGTALVVDGGICFRIAAARKEAVVLSIVGSPNDKDVSAKLGKCVEGILELFDEEFDPTVLTSKQLCDGGCAITFDIEESSGNVGSQLDISADGAGISENVIGMEINEGEVVDAIGEGSEVNPSLTTEKTVSTSFSNKV